MRTSLRSVSPPAAKPAPELLAAAAGIGDRLLREAIWDRGQCNWVGVDAGAAHEPTRGRLAHLALGPGLGSGTAGIALFLGQLHAATNDDAVRRTALAAIDRAVAHADQAPAHGLHAGRLGIAYAAARCGLLLGEERLCRHAARLARGRRPQTAESGVLSGIAGTIAGLIVLARLLGDERLSQPAGRLGDELAAAARRDREGWSWPAPGERHHHGLCGAAQGAAGVAWALLELFAVTGERSHRDAAERALDYERHWFDAREANWPDLRGIRRREQRGSFRPPYASTWSHGAPGIALTRLRAWKILGDDRYRAEAVTALATTAASVEADLIADARNFTLGHGLTGKGDVLLLGRELAADGPALAQRVCQIGIGRHAASVDGWPCGVPGGHAPALLTGHAGIGLLHLRLHDPTLPSPLLVHVPAT